MTPGPVSDSYKGPGNDTPLVPTWMQDKGEPMVKMYSIWLCDMCVSGEGGECHSPGCALFLNRAPDIPLQIGGNMFLTELHECAYCQDTATMMVGEIHCCGDCAPLAGEEMR
jgi:hypothetical protein